MDGARRGAAAHELGRHLTALLDRAADAGARSLQRPAEALLDAEEVLAAARATGDHEAAAAALRSAGMAARELEDLAAAEAFLRRAVRLARRHQLRLREGEARLTLAHVLALSGRTAAGRAEAQRAAELLEGPVAARALAQQSLIAQRSGHYADALDGYRRALTVFRRHGLDADVARLRVNRGITHAYRGELAAARADFDAAAAFYGATGHELALAEVEHDLGWVAALAGDVPTALRRYDEATATFRRLGVRRPLGLLDRCEALLSVGMARDALAAAKAAVAALEGDREGTDHAEALLACARAALAAGETAQARSTATLAEQRFRRQGRGPWAAAAAFVVLQADAATGHVSADEAGRLAAELAAAGWAAAALDARLVAGQAALAAGDAEAAASHLAAASTARRSGLAERRVRAWHAEALLRLRSGRRAAAVRALRAGLDVLAANRAALGASELRVGISRHGEALARLGVDLAVASGRPAVVLHWSERSRRATAAPPPAPDDPAVEHALARLRATSWELEEATFAADGRAPRLRREQARLEAAVRAAALRRAPGGDGAAARPPPVGDVRSALGERVLLELVVSQGELLAVVVDRRGARLRPLCAVADAEREVGHLRFALARAALADAGGDGERAAAALGASARRMAGLVLHPVRNRLGDAPVVVVPTGALHGIPWGVLPPLRGRPVVVAPSAAAWLRAARSRPAAGPAALVAGPGLRAAAREVQRLATVHPGSRVLRGAGATVAATVAGLAGASVAHVAAHGTFRGDNPRFSSLRLADGPLLVHDLERLAAPPATVVLSACHAAEAVISAGDEVLGLAGSLLALGTASVVASVAPVPDGPSVDWVVRFHRALARGQGPAEALAETAAAVDLDAGGPAAALAAFACYGAG